MLRLVVNGPNDTQCHLARKTLLIILKSLSCSVCLVLALVTDVDSPETVCVCHFKNNVFRPETTRSSVEGELLIVFGNSRYSCFSLKAEEGLHDLLTYAKTSLHITESER